MALPMNIPAATAISNAAGALGGLILVTPQNTIGYQPQAKPPLAPAPALLFHYEGENTSTLESDITDHYVENNTAIQDQIALKPVVITTQGFIGELNNVPPNNAFAVAQVAAQKLTLIGGYALPLSLTAQLAYNEAFFAYQLANTIVNNSIAAWSSINGNSSGGTSVITGLDVSAQPAQSQQQKYYQLFYGYWASRTLFTIQTPWAIFTDMAIKTLKATQSAETAVITDFTITFKQIRYAQALGSAVTATTSEGRRAQQDQSVSHAGTFTAVQSTSLFSTSGQVTP